MGDDISVEIVEDSLLSTALRPRVTFTPSTIEALGSIHAGRRPGVRS